MSSRSSNYRQVAQLVLEASRLAPQDRQRYLRKACGDDESMLAEATSLLEHFETPRVYLENPAIELDYDALHPPPDSSVAHPERIGPFTILNVLGSGGMGVVYRADQQNPKREVALKMMRFGLPTQRARRQFEREGELLARLGHPGIAQVYATGTDYDERPYIVMELIEGIPIDAHVAQHHPTITQRLNLLLQVCDAVQHAHQRGVIHRDIKAQNVLVEDGDDTRSETINAEMESGTGIESPRVKVLDFGVGRAFGEKATVHTEAGRIVGTLRSMSPEQIAGESESIDSRTDVYALGVLGYELLAGWHPFESVQGGLAEITAAVRTHEPAKLGTIDRSLRGDLETIIARAMEKDPSRRYQSAAELGGDIRRHLANEPIIARRATSLYQLCKLARRRPGVFAAAAVGLAALIAIAAVSTVSFLITFDANRDKDAALVTAKRQVAQADQVIEFLRDMLANANPSRSGGDVRVVEVLDRAGARIDAAVGGDPVAEADVRHTLGVAYWSLARYDDAEAHLRRAIQLRNNTLGAAHVDHLRSLAALADVILDQQQFEEAAVLADQLQELADPDSKAALDALSIQAKAGMLAGDLNVARQAATAANTLATTHHPQENRGPYLSLLAQISVREGALTQAETLYRNAIAELDLAHGPQHDETLTAKNNLAGLLKTLGKTEESETLLHEVIGIRREVFGEAHHATIIAVSNLAETISQQDRLDEAEPLYLDVRNALLERFGDDHPQTLTAENNLASCYLRMGRFDDAEPIYRRVRKGQEARYGKGHPATFNVMNNLARLLHKQGRPEASDELYKKLRTAAASALPDDHWAAAVFAAGHGRTLADLGRFGEAETLLRSSHERLRDDLGQQHKYTQRITGWLAEFYHQQDRSEEAAQYRALLETD